MNLLEINWWLNDPVDFEHKKWIFLAYLKKLDEAFYINKFSPFLLHSEMILSDMSDVKDKIITTTSDLTSKNIVFDGNYAYYEIDKPKLGEIETYLNILNYSIPLLRKKLDFGWELWKDNPTLLY